MSSPHLRLALLAAAISACGGELRYQSSLAPARVAYEGPRALERRDPGVPSEGALDDVDRSQGLVWRFKAASPIVGAPAVDADGRVYVVTSEGVVHALDVDGVFRWSYTLTGFASHPPSVGPRGRVYVATNERRIYALTPEGRRWWTFRSPVSVETHVGVGDRGVLYFGGSDEHLWALSSHAAALWRAKMDGPIRVGPVLSGNRKTAALGSASGLLSFFRGAHWRKNVRLSVPPMSQLEFVDERSVLVRAGGQLVLIADGEVVWRRPNIACATSGQDGSIFAITDAWEVLAVSGRGAVERRATLPGEPASRPAYAGDKVVVGSTQGKLWVVEADGAIRDIAVTHGAIGAVVADAQRGRVVVASGDGTVAAVRVTN